MAEFNRPPSDISPSQFFTSWLPAEYERLRAEAGSDVKPPDGTMVIQLEGADGGVWSISATGGTLSVSEGEPGTIDLRITQSVDDFRMLLSGANDADVLPPGASPVQMLLQGSAMGDALATVKGTLVFEVPGLAGRTFSTRVAFQDQADPNATISVGAETLQAMRSGALPPPQAFFAGKIQISGDQAFAMQVGMALMSRMQ